MWYIFPQIHGLGRSSISQFYAIRNLDEARAFLQDEYLGGNLILISRVLLELEKNSATEVFGKPDDRKLRSSMTLFALISEEEAVFRKVLDKYFDGKTDCKTINILRNTEDGIF